MPPPLLARTLLAALLPPEDRDDILANLADLYAARVARQGRWRAGAWYWRHVLSFPARFAYDRSRSAPTGAGGSWARDAAGDARFALRTFIRQPGDAVPAALTLSVGVAATMVVFTVVGATVLRPLPFPEPDRLVWLWPGGDFPLTIRQAEQLRRAAGQTVTLSGMANRTFATSAGAMPVEVSGATVSVNHFEVFGLSPVFGRGFVPGDAEPGAPPVALISHALWQSAFALDPGVIGREIRVDLAAAIPMLPGAFTGAPRTIVGVLPKGYAPFGSAPDILTPIVVDPADPNYRALGELSIVGRLQPSVRLETASREIDAVVGGLPELAAAEHVPPVLAMTLERALLGDLRSRLLMTLGAVLLVLAIACANVTHLSLARLTTRDHELAVRLALGAGPSRIARQLLTESLVTSLVASAAGLAAAWLALPAASLAIPETFGAAALAVDGRGLAFWVAILFATTIIAGAAPAFRGTRALGAALHGHRVVGDRRRVGRFGMHQMLITGEVALAVVLVASAGLLVRSFDRLVGVDPGFTPEGVATARFSPSAPKYGDVALRRSTISDVLSRVRRLPGVESAGAIHFLPVAEGGPSIRVVPDQSRPDEVRPTSYRVVTPGYFETMQIPLRRGRYLTDADDSSMGPVAVVNERLAAMFWPGADPIGRRIYRTNGTYWEVAGVVGDVRQQALGLAPVPELYLPMAQSVWANAMTIVARTREAPAVLGRQVEQTIHEVDAGVPVTRVAPMTDLMGSSVDGPRFYSRLFSIFGFLALGLGAVGVYGVAAYLVGRRRREIGIRLALGATRGQIMSRELGRGGIAVLAGLTTGAATAVAAAHVLREMLFDIAPLDPVALPAAIGLLAVVAFVAVFVPVRRATGINPLSVLRN